MAYGIRPIPVSPERGLFYTIKMFHSQKFRCLPDRFLSGWLCLRGAATAEQRTVKKGCRLKTPKII